MAENYWVVKQEPESYSWTKFVEEGGTAWTGIRNFQARKNLRSMKVGDLVFYYHTGDAKEVVGLARVTKEAYPDPTADEGEWSAVDLAPVKGLKRPVSLASIKADSVLKDVPLARHSRLSVLPLSALEFKRVLKLADTEV